MLCVLGASVAVVYGVPNKLCGTGASTLGVGNPSRLSSFLEGPSFPSQEKLIQSKLGKSGQTECIAINLAGSTSNQVSDSIGGKFGLVIVCI